MRSKQASNKSIGFTLIELLVVIAIIGILGSIVLGALNSARAKARDAQRLSELDQVQTALEMYYAKHGDYPAYSGISWQCPGAGVSAWNSSLAPLVTEGYLPALPADPLSERVDLVDYCYIYTTS